MKNILFALAVLSVVLVSDASARSLSKNRAEVLSRGEGYYKEIFMDSQFSRTEIIIGQEKQNLLKSKTVAVFKTICYSFFTFIFIEITIHNCMNIE